MKNATENMLVCLIAALLVAEASAAAAAPAAAAGEAQTILAKAGKVLFEDDFSRAEMAPKWKVGKGFWTIKDGLVTVAENPDDHHGAYAYVADRFPRADFVAEFSFKFDGAKSVAFLLDDNAYKGSHAGHICRVIVSPGQVRLTDSKLGDMKNEFYEKMKDPATTPEEKKKLQQEIKDKAANFKAEFDPSALHVLRVEVAGDEMLASIDGKPAGYLKSEGIAHPTKAMQGFTINGKSAQVDNVKIWEAAPSPEWAAHREQVLAALKK